MYELLQGGLIKDLPCTGKPLLEGPPAPALATSSIAWGLGPGIGRLDSQAMRFGPPATKGSPSHCRGHSGWGRSPAIQVGAGAWRVGVAVCVGKGAAKFLVLIQATESQK